MSQPEDCALQCLSPRPGSPSPDLAPQGPPRGQAACSRALKTAEITRRLGRISGRGLCWFSRDKASDELRPKRTEAQGERDLWRQSTAALPAKSERGHAPAGARSHRRTARRGLGSQLPTCSLHQSPLPVPCHPSSKRGPSDLSQSRSCAYRGHTQNPWPHAASFLVRGGGNEMSKRSVLGRKKSRQEAAHKVQREGGQGPPPREGGPCRRFCRR